MKKLSMFLLALISWDSSVFAQTATFSDSILTTGVAVIAHPLIESKAIIDTIHEPILVSTRMPGFIRTEMALAVRYNGVCVKHFDCHGRELKYPIYLWDCDNEKKRRVR